MSPLDLYTRHGYDLSRVAPKLYVGAEPPLGLNLSRAGFTMLVLCAREIQPPDHAYPNLHAIVRAPLDDGLPTNDEKRLALYAAEHVRKEREREGRVLVTCARGLNRSALVAGLALHELTGWRGPAIIQRLREARGLKALGNRHFRAMLEGLPATKWLGARRAS